MNKNNPKEARLAVAAIGICLLISSGCGNNEQDVSLGLPTGITHDMVRERSSDGTKMFFVVGGSNGESESYYFDTRNRGVVLPFLHPVTSEPQNEYTDQAVIMKWFWRDSVIQAMSISGKNTETDTLVLRQDTRSGIYFFERASPSLDLVALIGMHTKENPRAFDQVHLLPEDMRYSVGSWGRANPEDLVCHEQHEGYITISLPVSDAIGWLYLQYKFLFHTPDWVRYDLLQITRTQRGQGGGPGESFIAPDADDVLLYQASEIPEDLRWQPEHAGPDAYPGSSVDLTKDDDATPTP